MKGWRKSLARWVKRASTPKPPTLWTIVSCRSLNGKDCFASFIRSRGSRNLSMNYYRNLEEYIQALDREGLLYRIKRPINKDTEMHPLVRWQFRGLEEDQRR